MTTQLETVIYYKQCERLASELGLILSADLPNDRFVLQFKGVIPENMNTRTKEQKNPVIFKTDNTSDLIDYLNAYADGMKYGRVT